MKVYCKSPDFVQRDVAGECILVPIRRQLTQANKIFVLSETGAAFWSLLDGKRPLSKVVDGLLGEYDVSRDRLEDDLSALIKELLGIQAIQEAAP